MMGIGHKFGAGFLLVGLFSLYMGLSGFLQEEQQISIDGALIFATYMSPLIFIYGIFISWLISRKVKPINPGQIGFYVGLHGLGGLPFAVLSLSSQSAVVFLFIAGLGAFLAILFAVIEIALWYITSKGRIVWLVLCVPLLGYLAVFITGHVQSQSLPVEEMEIDDPGYSAREAVIFVTERHVQGENGGFPEETGKVEQWDMFGERFTRETVIEAVPGEKETYYVTLMEKNLDRREVYKTTYLTKENELILHNRVSEEQEG